MNVRQKALKILQEFRSQLDELDMSRQEYTKLQSYSRKVFKKMGELEAEPVETTGGECNGSCCGKHLCYKTYSCHQPKAEDNLNDISVKEVDEYMTKKFLRETPKEIKIDSEYFKNVKFHTKIDPLPRIDYCYECDAVHGYGCPKDAPKLPEKINQIYYDKNAGEALLRDKINEIIDYLEKHG